MLFDLSAVVMQMADFIVGSGQQKEKNKTRMRQTTKREQWRKRKAARSRITNVESKVEKLFAVKLRIGISVLMVFVEEIAIRRRRRRRCATDGD